MKTSAPILEVKDLCVWRENPILQDIAWKVEKGQHWVILGPNGSGKTSLLSALTAYLSPSSGEIHLLGKKYGETDWREHRKQVGIVSASVEQMIRDEETALKAVASGKSAVINYWGAPSEADSKRARKILKDVECGYLEERPWGYLSQGERQRVLIGRALMADFKLLILDEPCAGLDLVAREHFLAFLEKLAKKKDSPTLILVTHHVEEILPSFGHILLLKKGRTLACGKKGEILNSKLLSEAFGEKIRVESQSKRYSAKVAGKSSKVI